MIELSIQCCSGGRRIVPSCYNCPPLSNASRIVLNQPSLPTTRDYFFLSTHYDTNQPFQAQLLQLNAIHIYCITNTYHSIKHSPNNDTQDTYHACLKRLLQHDPRLINTYRLAQSTQLYNEQSLTVQLTINVPPPECPHRRTQNRQRTSATTATAPNTRRNTNATNSTATIYAPAAQPNAHNPILHNSATTTPTND